jgi:hypothetical protein
MNCAFRRDVTPIMWQLPLLEGRYNRWGDIWSGLIQKRVLDAVGQVMVINGRASVVHQRASDPHANLEREAPGVPFNETLWRSIGRLTGTMTEAWQQAVAAMADTFFETDPAYAKALLTAAASWQEACHA